MTKYLLLIAFLGCSNCLNCEEMGIFYTHEEGFEEVDNIYDQILKSHHLLDMDDFDFNEYHKRINALKVPERDIFHIRIFHTLVMSGGVECYLLSTVGCYFDLTQAAAANVGCQELVTGLAKIQRILPAGGLPKDQVQRVQAIETNEELREALKECESQWDFPESLWNQMLKYYHEQSKAGK